MNYIAIAISKKEVGIDIEFLFNIKEKKEYERFILTKKELEVLSLIVDGLSNQEISEKLVVLHIMYRICMLAKLQKYLFPIGFCA